MAYDSMRDRIVLVAAAEHPLAKQKRVVPADLAGQALIGFEGGSAIRRLIDEALRAAEVEVNVVMEVRSIAAILRLVESTASLAFVSEMSTEGRSVIDVRGLRIERELGLERLYAEYEEATYADLRAKITASCAQTGVPEEVFLSLLHKIYKRRM
jgi:DNA-binding transcriptional LysR family regulator